MFRLLFGSGTRLSVDTKQHVEEVVRLLGRYFQIRDDFQNLQSAEVRSPFANTGHSDYEY